MPQELAFNLFAPIFMRMNIIYSAINLLAVKLGKTHKLYIKML